MGMFAGTPFDRPPHCERCELPESECKCPPLVVEVARTPPEKQAIRLQVEKRKKGKVVTVVRGLAADNDLPALLKQLKNHCGAGGTLEGEDLELQGDHRERLQTLLTQLRFKVR